MWKQKDEEEVRTIRKRKKNAYKQIWRPGILALFVFLIFAIDEKIGFPRTIAPWFHPTSWMEFFEHGLLKAFWVALAFFAVLYALQLISKKLVFSEPDAMICIKCSKYKNDDKKYECDCGGEFVPLDEKEWIGEKGNSPDTE